MIDGIYVLNIHKKDDYYFVKNSKICILTTTKGKDCFVETIVAPERWRNARKLSEIELLKRLKKW